jgi:cell division protein FtsQ
LKKKVNHKTEGKAERAAKVKARARGAFDLGWRMLAAALLCAGLAAGAREGYLWAQRSPAFRAGTIAVTGLRRAHEAEVLRLSGLRAGVNLFAFDAGRAASKIEQHPWVRRAKVQRRFPPALEIRVEEREPAALVALGRLYFTDSEGQVFKRAAPGDPMDLPVVTGITRERFSDDTEEATARLRDALALLYAWRALDVSEVHVLEDRALEVQTMDGLRVRVGLGGYAEKLSRLRTLDEELRRRGARAAFVDLDNRARPEFVAVRLRG